MLNTCLVCNFVCNFVCSFLVVVTTCIAGISPKTNEQVSSFIIFLLEVFPEAVLFEGNINLSGYLGSLPIFPLHNSYHVPSSRVDDVFLTGFFTKIVKK